MRERCRRLSQRICLALFFPPDVLKWLMAMPHRCCYEDHQSCSWTDRKCQNNAAILAIFLMCTARTYKVARESRACMCTQAIGLILYSMTSFQLLQPICTYEGCLFRARLEKLSPNTEWHNPLPLVPPRVFASCFHCFSQRRTLMKVAQPRDMLC